MQLWRKTNDSPSTIQSRGGFGPRYYQPNRQTIYNLAGIQTWLLGQCTSHSTLMSAFNNVRGTAQSDMACSMAGNTNCGGVSAAYRYELNPPVTEYAFSDVLQNHPTAVAPANPPRAGNLHARVYMNHQDLTQATLIAIGIKYGTLEVAFVTQVPLPHITSVQPLPGTRTIPWAQVHTRVPPPPPPPNG